MEIGNAKWHVPWPIGARARAREWKTEIGKWKSETRSGTAPISDGINALPVVLLILY